MRKLQAGEIDYDSKRDKLVYAETKQDFDINAVDGDSSDGE
jgi:hypothetical protein